MNIPGYSVRSIIRLLIHDEVIYEERITLWDAESIEHAVELAEVEAKEYADTLGGTVCDLLQGFIIDQEMGVDNGHEVFSLMRSSELESEEYLDRFFDTGNEKSR